MVKKVRILGIDWSIKHTPTEDMSDNFGECHPGSHTIRINEILPESQQRAVLFHEIIEAVLNELEIEMAHKDVTALSAVLYAVIQDNALATTLTKEN